MTRKERKEQLRNRYCAIASGILIAGFIIGAVCNDQSNTYAIQSEGKTEHYKYVTEYKNNATYIGDYNFLDKNGNTWRATGEYKKGKEYTLIMHDNGTKNDIKDDVILEIR